MDFARLFIMTIFQLLCSVRVQNRKQCRSLSKRIGSCRSRKTLSPCRCIIENCERNLGRKKLLIFLSLIYEYVVLWSSARKIPLSGGCRTVSEDMEKCRNGRI